jgi:hypothetical protein
MVTEDDLLAAIDLRSCRFYALSANTSLIKACFYDQEVWQYLMIAERGESAPSAVAKI